MLRIKSKSIYFDNKKILVDTSILISLIILTALILIKYDLSSVIYEFARKNEYLKLDVIILLFAFSSIYMLFYMLKRFLELKELLQNANTDPLIGIINRRRGSKYIVDEIDLINTENYTSSLIMYDIDDFKKINDFHGHDIGDYVLKKVSKIVDNEKRNNDISIRWGGEEFIVICPSTNLEDAHKLAERFRVAIQSNLFNKKIKITASFGVIELHKNEDFKKQIIRVDKNLYESKKNGKNQITI